VVRPAGVIVTSAADAGSSLNGYNSSVSDEKLVASFGLFNWSNTDSSFTYALTVTGNKASGSEDITSKLNPSWEPSYLSADGTGVLAGDATEDAAVDIPLGNLDPNQDYESFTVSLKITDEAGKTTTQSVLIDRPAIDLSGRTWDTVYRSGTSYKTVTITTEDFDNLYYGKVASDTRVPFSDAEGFKRYLGHAKTEEEMQERFNRYIYDLFDPSPKGNKTDVNDYEDRILSWPKDSTAPSTHRSPSLINDPKEYSLADAGVTYNSQYFSDLSKTVSPDLGDANTKREYEIDLSAKADPVAKIPVAYVFMIQTSWQMFDQKHAQAQKKKEKGDGTGKPMWAASSHRWTARHTSTTSRMRSFALRSTSRRTVTTLPRLPSQTYSTAEATRCLAQTPVQKRVARGTLSPMQTRCLRASMVGTPLATASTFTTTSIRSPLRWLAFQQTLQTGKTRTGSTSSARLRRPPSS
jgi:hypothetical protein